MPKSLGGLVDPEIITRLEDLELATAFLNEDQFASNNAIVSDAIANVLARSVATQDRREQQPPPVNPPAPPLDIVVLQQQIFDAAREAREAQSRLDALREIGAPAEQIVAAETVVRVAEERAQQLSVACRVLACEVGSTSPPTSGTGHAIFRVGRVGEEFGFEFSSTISRSFAVGGFETPEVALLTVQTLQREAASARVSVDLHHPPKGRVLRALEEDSADTESSATELAPAMETARRERKSKPQVAVFEIFQTESGQDFRFRLRLETGDILLLNEGFPTLQAAKESIEAVRSRVTHERSIERGQSEGGEFFIVHGSNREPIAYSPPFPSAEARDRCLEIVRQVVLSASFQGP